MIAQFLLCALGILSRAPYGVSANGEPVEVLTLRNQRGVTVRVLTYGGVISEISVPDRKGSFANVVVALPDLKAYEAHPNFSSLLGRYANRIADGENGYPGQLSVTVRYILTDTLKIEYTARTGEPTVLNLSHHVYFNLAGTDTILGESLQVFADRYTVLDARKIPTGQIDPVAGTELDLRLPTVLRDFNLDHNFVLNHLSVF